MKNFVTQGTLHDMDFGFSDEMFELDTIDVERQRDKNFPATSFQITGPQAMIWAIIMVMAMIGGAMMPLVFMPDWMQKVSNFSIVKWSIYALESGIWRDLSFLEIVKPCGILIGIGLLCFGMGSFLLRRSEA